MWLVIKILVGLKQAFVFLHIKTKIYYFVTIALPVQEQQDMWSLLQVGETDLLLENVVYMGQPLLISGILWAICRPL